MNKNLISLSLCGLVFFLIPWGMHQFISPQGGMLFTLFLCWLLFPVSFLAFGIWSGFDFNARWYVPLVGLFLCFLFLNCILQMDHTVIFYLLIYGFLWVFVMCITGLLLNWNRVEKTELESGSHLLPENFDGYRIAQISDFHNVLYGDTVCSLLKNQKIDIIVITGDLIDSRNTKPEISLEFVKKLIAIAPTYYIPGNHESRLELYSEFRKNLEGLGCTVLENQTISIEKDKEIVEMTGIMDPGFFEKYKKEEERNYFSECLGEKGTNYRILLVHRPEHFDTYAGNADLVFCGHAHGGQFILPFLGGLIAPGQGLFPNYYQGIYHKEGTDMVVSRGVGYTVFPFRLNNPPEVVVVTLKKEQ